MLVATIPLLLMVAQSMFALYWTFVDQSDIETKMQMIMGELYIGIAVTLVVIICTSFIYTRNYRCPSCQRALGFIGSWPKRCRRCGFNLE